IRIAPRDTSMLTATGSTALLSGEAAVMQILGHAAQRCESGAADMRCPSSDGTLWASSRGDRLELHGGPAPNVGVNQYQFMAGADWRRGCYTLGGALGYGHSDLSETGTGDSGRVDTLRAALYSARYVGPTVLSAALSYAYDDLHSRRPFGVAGTAEGNTSGSE